jgi:hypothetical protein
MYDGAEQERRGFSETLALALSPGDYLLPEILTRLPGARRSTAQLRVEPCGLSREVVAFGEVGR